MKQQGFTLVELLIVSAITAIISYTAVPNITFMIEKNRINTDIFRLLLLIQTTRQNSINFSTTSVLCPTESGSRCTRNWKLPLMLFSDSNKNKKRDTDEPIIHQFKAFNEPDVLIGYPKTQIRFNEQGMANYYNGTMSYCLNQTVKGIIISRVGRIRFARDLDGDHIPDVNPSTPVSCQ